MTERAPIGQNGLFLRGKIHYEIDSYLAGQPNLPPQLYHLDQYHWELEEELEALQVREEVAAVNEAAAISPRLLSVLTTVERTVVFEHIWEQKPFHVISQLFPQHDEHGVVRTGSDGETLYHDHKWVQRRFKDAVRKMRKAAAELPASVRVQTTHHIPAQYMPGSVTERIATDNVEREAAGHEVRVLAREVFHRRRNGR